MSHIQPHPDADEALQAFAVQFREQLRSEIARIGAGAQTREARQIVAAHLQLTDRMVRKYLSDSLSQNAGEVSLKTLYLAAKNLGFLFEHDGVLFTRLGSFLLFSIACVKSILPL